MALLSTYYGTEVATTYYGTEVALLTVALLSTYYGTEVASTERKRIAVPNSSCIVCGGVITR